MGQCDTRTHECLGLPVVVLGNKGKPVKYQGSQFGVGALTAPLDHVHNVVGASALVAEDRTGELTQGIIQG